MCVKPTAWIAGFPVINAELQITSSDGDDKNRTFPDYIGPLIDIGFRLAKFSTPKKFILSADLAWMLLHSEHNPLEFYFDGQEELKGVFNKKYPLIWLKTNYDPLENVEKLKGEYKKDPCDTVRLKSYLDKFLKELEENGGPIIRPFIDGVFGKKPAWYRKNFKNLKKLPQLDGAGLEQNPPDSSKSSAGSSKILKDIKETAKKNQSAKQRSSKKAKKH